MAKRIGVVLSGCGVYDGSEIHESVLILLALDRAGAESVCLAPDIAQRHVVSHVTNDESTGESRNVLSESARIARGRVRDLNNVTSAELDGVIFAGGFGAVKNLCDYAYKGPDCSVDPSVSKLLKDFHQVRKPIGAMCIAPVIIAKVLGASHPRLTIGTDKNTAKDIEKLGAVHVPCPVTDCVVDTKSKIVTTPAYMLASRITEAQAGIEKTCPRDCRTRLNSIQRIEPRRCGPPLPLTSAQEVYARDRLPLGNASTFSSSSVRAVSRNGAARSRRRNSHKRSSSPSKEAIR